MELNLICALSVASLVISSSFAYKHRVIPTDINIFSVCEDEPQDTTRDVNGIFDLKEFNFKTVGDKTSASGNITCVFDFGPGDRLMVDGSLLHFERGSWQPTFLSLKFQNFCSVMYDKNHFLYQYFFINVENQEDIKDECMNKGTKMQFRLFDLDYVYESYQRFEGEYKLKMKATAIDKNGVPKPITICAAMKGEIVRI